MKNSIRFYLIWMLACMIVFAKSELYAQNTEQDGVHQFAKTHFKLNLLSPTYELRSYLELGVQRRMTNKFGMGLFLQRYLDSYNATKRSGETYKGVAARLEVFRHYSAVDLGFAFSMHKMINETYHPVVRREATYIQNMLLDRHVWVRDYQLILNWRWDWFNSYNCFMEFYTRFGIQRAMVGFDVPEDGYLLQESSWVRQDSHDDKMFKPGDHFYASFDIGLRIALGW